MSEDLKPRIDPDSAQPIGDISQLTRRKIRPHHVAVAFVLAVIITAISAAVIALVIWGAARLFHWG